MVSGTGVSDAHDPLCSGWSRSSGSVDGCFRSSARAAVVRPARPGGPGAPPCSRGCGAARRFRWRTLRGPGARRSRSCLLPTRRRPARLCPGLEAVAAPFASARTEADRGILPRSASAFGESQDPTEATGSLCLPPEIRCPGDRGAPALCPAVAARTPRSHTPQRQFAPLHDHADSCRRARAAPADGTFDALPGSVRDDLGNRSPRCARCWQQWLVSQSWGRR